MLPDGTLHHLPTPEQLVVFWVVEKGTCEDTEVEYLVAGPAEIESSRWTPLRDFEHIDYRPLDVDVAS